MGRDRRSARPDRTCPARRPEAARRPGRLARAGLLAATLLAGGMLAGGLAGCRTQVWPGPMESSTDPLPPGMRAVEPGLDEVIVTRLSDPVRVRPAGAVASVPLPYVDKRRRLLGGSTVHLAGGGRAEIAWPGEGLLVQLFDAGHLRVGVRERGEPAAILYRPTRVVAELPGGTILRIENACDLIAPDGDRVGPLRIERTLAGILRLFNNGSTQVTLDLGDSRQQLGPSQSIDLVEIDRRAERARAGRRGLGETLPLGDGSLLRWSGPLGFSARGDSIWLGAQESAVVLDAAGTLWHLPPGGGVQITADPSWSLAPVENEGQRSSSAGTP